MVNGFACFPILIWVKIPDEVEDNVATMTETKINGKKTAKSNIPKTMSNTFLVMEFNWFRRNTYGCTFFWKRF